MFTRWGELVHKFRYTVLGVAVAALLALGAYGFGLENHLSSSGWFDPGAESSQAAVLKDEVYGRDHMSDVIALYTAPDGKTIDDPEFGRKITDNLNSLPREHPDQISKVNVAYWKTETGDWSASATGSKDKKYAFASVAIKGDDDTTTMNNYRAVKDAFYIPGVDVQLAGMQPVAGTLNDTIASDQKRMEMLAIPAVAVLLFFIFGGIVAAALPLIIGGLTVLGANGIVMAITHVTEVNSFVGAVVSMIGLGLAIDYGLFIVSRFREELAEGYTTRQAVRRSVMTAGRTVTFSATMIIAASAGMLLFPQGFLKSVAYGTIATVLLAALASLTILPALLSILGPRVDALGFKRFRKTKTAEEVENGFWGRTTQWVMKHPLKVAVPLCIILLLLIIPVKNLKFGGISETYLPPDNPTRMAQEKFDEIFPLRQTDPIQLVITTQNTSEIKAILDEASGAPGLTDPFGTPGIPPNGSDVWVSEATMAPDADVEDTIAYLRSIHVPDDVDLMVGGQPVLMQDSIDSLLDRMPLMIVLVVFVTTLLMFLTFGSLVLPIKAALMSALGLGSTLGILTWIFVDGHGAGLLNFTPQPIMSPVLVLIMAVIYGLSTDYEVFLLSRMVETRAQGASTTESVRSGTAQTGRIITAAALILLVVVGAFAFSDLVMMQYIAYGMMAALFIDATVLRMLLVPATMKLLGDDCWWAPAWMKRIQQRIGLGEPILDDERPGTGEVVDLVKTTPVTDPVTMQLPQLPDGTPKGPRKPRRLKFLRVDPEAPTEQLDRIDPTAAGTSTRATRAKNPASPRAESPTQSRAKGTDRPRAGSSEPTRAEGSEPSASRSGGPTARTGEPAKQRAAESVASSDAGAQKSDSSASEQPGKAEKPGRTEKTGKAEKSAKRKRFGFRRSDSGADAPSADSGNASPDDHADDASDGTANQAPPAASGSADAAAAHPPTGPEGGRSSTSPQTPGIRSSRVLPPPARPQPPRASGGSGVLGGSGVINESGVIGAGPSAGDEAGRGPGTSEPASMPRRPAADRDGTPESHVPQAPSAPPSVSLPGSDTAPNRGVVRPPQVVRPGMPPRTVPAPDTAPDATDSVPPTAPVGTTPRVLPPKPSKVPPHPSVRAQLYRPDAPPYHPGQPPAQGPGQTPDAGRPQQGPDRTQRVAPEGRPPAVQPPRRVPPDGMRHSSTRTTESGPGSVPPGMSREPKDAEATQELHEPANQGNLPPAGGPNAPAPGPRGDLGSAMSHGPRQTTSDAGEPAASTAPEAESPTPAAESDASGNPADHPAGPGGDNRNNIEQWMADLRSSRRRPEPEPADPDDEGKHRTSGRTVSVNELLRRQNRD
ncbi:RND superfamily putative drug exporter [Nocardia kruczakiae]|uniref:RND superfamily putative drug exporter n=1 Tax=Nocardia kruczakiae TaxID=261477 RepID=A0ABU1XBM0_9NOCA|nr:MMPL family transporter [Nocardia kruczakiae]MDR7167945.1 RND superfamily putative drug exporter [Nocardia kruczakiae]